MEEDRDGVLEVVVLGVEGDDAGADGDALHLQKRWLGLLLQVVNPSDF